MPEPTPGGHRPPTGDPDHTWVMLKSARSSCSALSASSADGRSWEPPAPREKPPYLGTWGEPGAAKRSPGIPRPPPPPSQPLPSLTSAHSPTSWFSAWKKWGRGRHVSEEGLLQGVTARGPPPSPGVLTATSGDTPQAGPTGAGLGPQHPTLLPLGSQPIPKACLFPQCPHTQDGSVPSTHPWRMSWG